MKKQQVWVVVAALLLAVAATTEAVTCSVLELSSCAAAMQYGTPASQQCCSKLKEQKPCLCNYLKDPSLRQYVTSPNAKRVASSCGVSYPKSC